MKIAMIAGSNRNSSSSTGMLHYIDSRLRTYGHSVSIWDLYADPLPFYDPNDDAMPDSAARLAKMVEAADAIVLATPEYHGSLSGVLKNALDYLGSEQFAGKMVLCVSSAGGSVGVSSLQHMQAIVRNVHGINCPEWISIEGNQRTFTDNGEPAQEAIRARVENVLRTFANLAGKLMA